MNQHSIEDVVGLLGGLSQKEKSAVIFLEEIGKRLTLDLQDATEGDINKRIQQALLIGNKRVRQIVFIQALRRFGLVAGNLDNLASKSGGKFQRLTCDSGSAVTEIGESAYFCRRFREWMRRELFVCGDGYQPPICLIFKAVSLLR